MRTLVVSQREVRELLPMAECIDVVAAAFHGTARERVAGNGTIGLEILEVPA